MYVIFYFPFFFQDFSATTPNPDHYNYSPEVTDDGGAEGDYDGEPEGEEEYDDNYPDQNSAGIGASAI